MAPEQPSKSRPREAQPAPEPPRVIPTDQATLAARRGPLAVEEGL